MWEEAEIGAREGDVSSHQIPSRIPRKVGQQEEVKSHRAQTNPCLYWGFAT